MKIDIGIALHLEQEIDWLDYGLPNILEKTKHDVNITLFLSRVTDKLLDKSIKLCDKYNINFEPRGDNSPIVYYDELKHNSFDIKKNDCAMVLQPDVVFLKKDVFDSIIEEASQYFDTKYQINVSTDHPDDSLPLGIQIFTKKMWDEIGCADINYYPAAGSEVDEYRRCFIKWGLDLNNTELYLKLLDGIQDIPFTHRIRSKNLMHIGKFRGGEIEQPKDHKLFKTRYADYSIYALGNYGISHNWVQYYVNKWGGSPGCEIYKIPFNNVNNSVKITWQDYFNPYPESKFISLRGLIL